MSAADSAKKVEVKVEADQKEKVDDKSDLVSKMFLSYCVFVKSFHGILFRPSCMYGTLRWATKMLLVKPLKNI